MKKTAANLISEMKEKLLDATSTRAIDIINRLIKKAPNNNLGLNGTLKLIVGDQVIYINGKTAPNTVSASNDPADCSIKMTSETFNELIGAKRKITIMTAYMLHRVEISGDRDVSTTMALTLDNKLKTIGNGWFG